MFKRRASEYVTLLASSAFAQAEMESELNPKDQPVKRGAFEITIETEDGTGPINIWSGLNRGPPRRLKFPESSELMQIIKKKLQ